LGRAARDAPTTIKEIEAAKDAFVRVSEKQRKKVKRVDVCIIVMHCTLI
jgi:hypothetical protein